MQDVPLQRDTAAAWSLRRSSHSQAQTSQSARPPTVLESSHCRSGDSMVSHSVTYTITADPNTAERFHNSDKLTIL